MEKAKTILVDGVTVPLAGEKNLLEVIRKANIDIPTFCYHSELSVYGACRLCIVDVQGRGLLASCSQPPEPGMVVRTNTEEIREIRKVNLELLLASHDTECPSCPKNDTCKLRALAARVGVSEINYKHVPKTLPLDDSSQSLVRDPNKCILCGDCVRYCEEIQGIGAIGFIGRGSLAMVAPPFGKGLGDIECVNCGGCAKVCPTGAITPRSETKEVWAELENPAKKVVAQIAPAVRVALGEMFGMPPGEIVTGKIVAAMKRMGFDMVFDTSFAADLTVVEEANEFLKRKKEGKNLPILTSCCPAWVKKAEHFDAEILPHLSTCKSPQQMFGSITRTKLAEQFGVTQDNLIVVSIMPCTAKKFEARRPEFTTDGVRDVSYVLTTQELGTMINETGIVFESLEPAALDLPFGFATGAGVIFGNSGGVSEAVLRYAAQKLGVTDHNALNFKQLRGTDDFREAELDVMGVKLRLAVVYGLKNTQKIVDQIKDGTSPYDIVEVMACQGGCIGGAGQPVTVNRDAKKLRTAGLFAADASLPIQRSQDNPYIIDIYKNNLSKPGSKVAHHLLHTEYAARRRSDDDGISLTPGSSGERISVNVCVGTGCYVRGSQRLLQDVLSYVEKQALTSKVDVRATFCMENCDKGPTVVVGGTTLNAATIDTVISALTACITEGTHDAATATTRC
jgi:NADH-quinone oxidoreductase subunit G